ncbi:MAG: hypothetical protein AAGJ09_05010 [Pseudomonadota bacterium]
MDGFEVVFDPVSSTSHILSPVHKAILSKVPLGQADAINAAGLLAELDLDYDVQSDAAATDALQEALAHLLQADLIETIMVTRP